MCTERSKYVCIAIRREGRAQDVATDARNISEVRMYHQVLVCRRLKAQPRSRRLRGCFFVSVYTCEAAISHRSRGHHYGKHWDAWGHAPSRSRRREAVWLLVTAQGLSHHQAAFSISALSSAFYVVRGAVPLQPCGKQVVIASNVPPSFQADSGGLAPLQSTT